MARHTTIYDVAAAAGVSISTVSNVLNRPERVRPETRAKVLAAVDDLGFVPAPAAVSQARRGVATIAVVAPFTTYASFYSRLTGVLREARGAGIEVRVVDIPSAAESTSPVIAASAVSGRVDGLLVMGERLDPDVERRLAERRMPTVVVDASSEAFSSVVSDDFRGGVTVGNHLLSLGHTRLAHLTEQQRADYASQARRRHEGFVTTVERAGAQVVVTSCGPGTDQARRAARDLLARPERPTAVFAHYDELAVGVVRAAGDLGLSVPGDVSVVGYDDGPAATAADLTTVHQPLEESGAMGMRRLLAELREGRTPRTVTSLDCTLVVRGSTGAPTPSAASEGQEAGVAEWAVSALGGGTTSDGEQAERGEHPTDRGDDTPHRPGERQTEDRVQRPRAGSEDGERDGDDRDEGDVLPAAPEDEEALAAVVGEGGDGHQPDERRGRGTGEQPDGDEHTGADLGRRGQPGVQRPGTQPERLEPPGGAGQAPAAPHLVGAVQDQHRAEREAQQQGREVEVHRAPRGRWRSGRRSGPGDHSRSARRRDEAVAAVRALST